MNLKTVLAVMALLAGVPQIHGKLPKQMLPTEKEELAFLNEADDFIDDMADGLQDRQADAILHAMRGEGRELMKLRASRDVDRAKSASVERRDFTGTGIARGLKMRLYSGKEKRAGERPLFIYFHGGGWCFGSNNSCSSFCDAIAASGIAAVLSVEYSLSPESSFGTSVMDCAAAVEYASEHAVEWGCSPKLISLGGDSAGGNLALAATIALHRSDSPVDIKSLVLYYPVVKGYNDKSASWKKYSRGYGLDGRLMETFIEAYMGSGINTGNRSSEDIDKEILSPGDAPDEVLKRLPPVLIIGGTRDILYDQGKEFAFRLRNLGNTSEYVEFPGAIHLFITVEGQPTAFSKAVALTGSFLK